MRKTAVYFLCIFMLLVPVFFATAATGSPNTGNPSNSGSPNPGNPSSPGSPNPGNPSGGGVTLTNPLGDKDIIEFLQDILDVIMVFAVPLIVFMIIYAGFLFVMDRGSDQNLKKAKNALLYAVIGGVIILGAQAILAVVQGTVDAFRN